MTIGEKEQHEISRRFQSSHRKESSIVGDANPEIVKDKPYRMRGSGSVNVQMQFDKSRGEPAGQIPARVVPETDKNNPSRDLKSIKDSRVQSSVGEGYQRVKREQEDGNERDGDKSVQSSQSAKNPEKKEALCENCDQLSAKRTIGVDQSLK